MSINDDFKSAFKGALFDSQKWTYEVLPTGCVPIDLAIVAGGFGEGRIGEIFGSWSCAKTLVLYQWLIETQRRGGKTFLFESEGGFHADWFVSLGGVFGTGTDADLLVIPNLTSVEDFFSGCDKIIAVIEKTKYEGKVAIGWDSLAATATKLLDKKGVEGSHAAKKALVISEGVTRLSAQITGTRISVVNTNQTKIKMGSKDWEETHTPGGRAWPYMCSVRMELEFDGGPSGSKILDSNGDMIGRSIRGKIVKNKLGPPFREFKFPVYTEAGVPHPEFDGVLTTVGLDCDEALLYWYLGNTRAVFGEDKQRFMEVKGGGFIALNPNLFEDATKFRKKDWPKILESYPDLRDPRSLAE